MQNEVNTLIVCAATEGVSVGLSSVTPLSNARLYQG
jgi:hypothetical protein